jgi:hypothetical protein
LNASIVSSHVDPPGGSSEGETPVHDARSRGRIRVAGDPEPPAGRRLAAEARVAMEDWKAGFRAELRAIEIATAGAAASVLPDLLRRLHRHQAGLDGPALLTLYRRWRIRRLSRAVADARWQMEQGRLARLGGLDPRR